jgi:hypothetical protein
MPTEYLSIPAHSHSQSQNYITTDGQSASLFWCQAPVLNPRPIVLLLSLFLDRYGFVNVGRPLLREAWSVVFSCCSTSPAQSFSGLSPARLSHLKLKLSYDWRRVGQSILVSGSRDKICFSWKLRFSCCGAPSLTRGGWIRNLLIQALPEQSLSRPSPVELTTILCCLIWDSRSPYSHPPGTGRPRYTPGQWVSFS